MLRKPMLRKSVFAAALLMAVVAGYFWAIGASGPRSAGASSIALLQATTEPDALEEWSLPMPASDGLISNSLSLADFCTILSSDKLQDYLAMDATQKVQLNARKEKLQSLLARAAKAPIEGPSTDLVLLGRAKRLLALTGEEVRDLLTADQDSAFEALFVDGLLRPVQIKVAAATETGNANASGHPGQAYREIDIRYSKFDPDVPAAAPQDAMTSAVSTAVAAQPGLDAEFNTKPTGAASQTLLQGAMATRHMGETFPANTVKTDLVGGRGGEPFVSADANRGPIVGFHYMVARWLGHQVIHELDPIYQQPNAAYPTGDGVILAKDGYVVGGLMIDSDDSVNGFRVLFARYQNGKVDVTDNYATDWFGDPQGDFREQIGCHGETITGIYGRQGINLDAVGLVVASGN